MTTPNSEPATGPSNFIRDIVLDDLKTNKYQGRVHTRFPPEPNGYLHIGHAKSICLNFGLAAEFGGKTNLRFDDTNPSKEETEYVDSIIENVRWLGFDWEDRMFYASDYFHQLYDWAVQMIREGKAFVCDLSADEIRQYRGTPTEPGRPSPYRNRSVEENLDLFARMKAGEFPDGSAHAAGQDRHGGAELQPAGPDHVPDRARGASSHGERMVHLPDVRLRARAERFDRGHHAFHLHAGIRRSPSALRLVHRRAGNLSSAADRIRPAEHHVHAAQQAQAAAAGAGGSRARLGRSAHADARRDTAPGLHSGGHAQLLRGDRAFENQRDHRTGPAGVLRPRRSQQARAARDGGAASLKGSDR